MAPFKNREPVTDTLLIRVKEIDPDLAYFLRKTPAVVRANPNQPWYSKFRKKEKRRR